MQAATKQDVIEWEVRNWGKTLDFWEPHLPTAETTKALTVGERNGGLSLWLAQKGFQVTSTDLEGVTGKAHDLHRTYQVEGRIEYQAADMTQLPFDDNSFDLIAFKSVVGALSTKSNQQQAFDELYRVLKPGGTLVFAENLTGTSFHQWIRKKFVKWSTYWRYLHPNRDFDLLSQFSEVKDRTHGVLAVFGRSEGQRDFLARIDSVLSPITPKSWRYIWFVVAKKKC